MSPLCKQMGKSLFFELVLRIRRGRNFGPVKGINANAASREIRVAIDS